MKSSLSSKSQTAAESFAHKGIAYGIPSARVDGNDVIAAYNATHDAVERARRGADEGTILAESQNLARELSNQPGNALPPAELAKRAQRTAKEVGLRVRVLGVPELKRLKMGAILAVGQGSANPPRLVVLEHRPRRSGKKVAAQPFCIVGKGITFDSGGISIKPSAGMDEMKHDMSGAATVVGALRACALLDLPIPVIGVIGAAENMPSGTAYRPGDIVTAMSGKQIEVLNTDAEGRVVLADALHFARTVEIADGPEKNVLRTVAVKIPGSQRKRGVVFGAGTDDDTVDLIGKLVSGWCVAGQDRP